MLLSRTDLEQSVLIKEHLSDALVKAQHFFFFDVFLLLRSSFHVPNLACRALCYYPVPYGSRDLQVFKK